MAYGPLVHSNRREVSYLVTQPLSVRESAPPEAQARHRPFIAVEGEWTAYPALPHGPPSPGPAERRLRPPAGATARSDCERRARAAARTPARVEEVPLSKIRPGLEAGTLVASPDGGRVAY